MSKSVIVLVAAVVLLAAGFFLYQTQIFKPQPVVQNSTTPTPTESATYTPTPTPTVQANPNANVFSSAKLGISFDYAKLAYDSKKVGVKEEGNKVYIFMEGTDPNSGQWVEVFSKSKTDSLTDAIKKKFLVGYPEADCQVEEKSAPPNQTAQIVVPADPGEGMDTLSAKWEKCPATYTSTNGLSYFLMNQDHKDKFVYFSIGQYGIPSGTGDVPWQDTIKFL